MAASESAGCAFALAVEVGFRTSLSREGLIERPTVFMGRPLNFPASKKDFFLGGVFDPSKRFGKPEKIQTPDIRVLLWAVGGCGVSQTNWHPLPQPVAFYEAGYQSTHHACCFTGQLPLSSGIDRSGLHLGMAQHG